MTARFDVVILGAGSAGAALAGMLAAAGRKVALVEARRFDVGGARWVNDVPPWMFDRAGVTRPEPPERSSDPMPVTLVGGAPRARLAAGLRPMWGVDMRRLTARLRAEALRAGAEPFEGATLDAVEERGGRLEAVTLRARRVGEGALAEGAARHPTPTLLTLRAQLFVDATGTRQSLLRRSSALAADCPPPEGADVCTAHQQVREIADRDGARAFLERHGVAPGQVLTFLGLRGGYSTLGVIVDADLAHVEVLTGVGGGTHHGRASQLQRELVGRERWIGRVIYGGGGRIPIRRPYDRLAAPGLALLGDAACQVFPVHGSGVGSGLVAARILAEAIAGFDDPGCERATWAYQAGFHRERGGVHAAYDVMRRATQRLDAATLDTLLASGLVSQQSTAAALAQELHSPSLAEVGRLARSAARAPRAAAGLVWSALRMPAVVALYGRYPTTVDVRALRRWARGAAALCGHAADVRGP